MGRDDSDLHARRLIRVTLCDLRHRPPREETIRPERSVAVFSIRLVLARMNFSGVEEQNVPMTRSEWIPRAARARGGELRYSHDP